MCGNVRNVAAVLIHTSDQILPKGATIDVYGCTFLSHIKLTKKTLLLGIEVVNIQTKHCTSEKSTEEDRQEANKTNRNTVWALSFVKDLLSERNL